MSRGRFEFIFLGDCPPVHQIFDLPEPIKNANYLGVYFIYLSIRYSIYLYLSEIQITLAYTLSISFHQKFHLPVHIPELAVDQGQGRSVHEELANMLANVERGGQVLIDINLSTLMLIII